MKRQEIPYRMPDGSTNWLQPGSQAHQSTPYVHGDFYSMKASEIHSITFSRDALVLFFEGPEKATETLILEPFVDGQTVPTFQVQPWMYAPTP